MAQALGASTLSSPSRLLAELEKNSNGSTEPPLEELLDSVQRQQRGAAPPASADRLEVFPEPGFVVKTANEQGQKVFVNVCGSGKMPLPPGWTRGGEVPAEVKQHLEGGQGGDAPACMRFPMSMGAARIDVDHRGQPCLVIDCILSTELLAACATYRPVKLFLIQLALGMAAQQTGLELDPQYRLPKMRYKGEGGPPPQLIRLAPGVGGTGAGSSAGTGDAQDAVAASGPAGASAGRALITEVGGGEDEGEGEPAFALLATKRQQRQQLSAAQQQRTRLKGAPVAVREAQQAAAQPAAQKQDPQLQQPGPGQAESAELQAQIEYEGKPATGVCITVPLPPAAAAAAARDPGRLRTSVCAETVQVHAPGCQPLEVRLAFAVNAAEGSAEVQPVASSGAAGGKVGQANAKLVLRLPYRPFGSVLQELQQAKAAGAADGKVGGRQNTGSRLMELD